MVELTKKELEDLELQAMQEVEDEEKEELKEQALKKAKVKLKAKGKEASSNLAPGTRMVAVNLGKHSDRIIIDGRTFLHGRSYALTQEQEETIRDMAFRTHVHQAELKGGKWMSEFYGRRQANATI